MFPINETIIETKTCPISGQNFFVTDKDLEFYDTISPIFGGKKYNIPSPILSPDERTRRRFCHRNERHLYSRKSSLSGKQIISNYGHHAQRVVYDVSEWFSDTWSAHEYSQDFDFTKPFFPQFDSISQIVPQISLAIVNCENSNYCNYVGNVSDSYLIFGSVYCKKCFFGSPYYCTDCLDSLLMRKGDHCYECIDCTELSNCTYCQDCHTSRNLYHCIDCKGCTDCIGCVGLRNSSFYIYNQPVSKEEYLGECARLSINFPQRLQGKIREVYLARPHKALQGENNENTVGNYCFNCKNSFTNFYTDRCEDTKFCQQCVDLKNCYDNNFTEENAWCYEHIGNYRNHHLILSKLCHMVSNGIYCSSCFDSTDIFGCDGLKHGHHCILNKPYSIEEYESLCAKIIDHMRSTGEWGEFFPHELSPFGYDETVAQEYFPLTEEEVKRMPRFEEWRFGAPLGRGVPRYEAGGCVGCPNTSLTSTIPISHRNPPALCATPLHRGAITGSGWNWKGEEETSSYHGPYYTPLPIEQYDEKIVGYEVAKKNIDELLNGILQCEVTKKPFKVIRQELAFYIENGIPIPSKHPDQRHKERMQMRNPRKLFERKCTECAKDIITTYAPEKLERVVCEECYRSLVY